MINLVKDIEKANYVTHSGTMHADDVFSTAFLELYKKDIKLLRTSGIDAKDYKNKIIYDIGYGEFDHHQKDVKVRDNGIKYASLGLLWEKFGKKYLKQEKVEDIDEVYNYIEKDLIEQIDAIDNGQFPRIEAKYKVKTLSETFKLFNPKTFSDEDHDQQFIKAVKVAKILFEEEVLQAQTKVKANKIIIDKLKKNNDKQYLVLNEFIPFEETIMNEEIANNILFVIYPSSRGGYAIKTLPKSNEDRSSRMLFPSKWKGLRDEELEKVSGIKGLIFCHNSLFIATTTSLDTAIEVVNKVIEKEV